MELSKNVGGTRSDALAIPVNPVVQAALRSLYSGAYGLWDTGLYGSQFNYQASDGHISLFYEFPPNIREMEYSQLFMCPRMARRRILQFCGALINERNPGQTIDAFIKAHNRLLEYHSLQAVSEMEPLARTKGYFKAWLDTPISVKLSDHLWQVQNREACQDEVLIQANTCLPQAAVSWERICRHPRLIKELRNNRGLHQEELARAVGISRQTLSKYERGLQVVPPAVATKLASIYHKKAFR